MTEALGHDYVALHERQHSSTSLQAVTHSVMLMWSLYEAGKGIFENC